MKSKTLFLICCIFMSSMLYGQANDLKVVASAGTSFETENLSLDWTLGEVVVEAYESQSFGLSQGFHQPVYQIVSVKSIPAETGLITVFPNPFSNQLNVKMNFANIEKGEIDLVDSKGMSVWKKEFEGNEVIEQYSAEALPSGSYRIVVSVANGVFVQSYQIIKMH